MSRRAAFAIGPTRVSTRCSASSPHRRPPERGPFYEEVAMTTLEVTASEIDRLVREQFSIIETGDLALADANVTTDFVNHRAGHEPVAARGRGSEALKATAIWLRQAFSELRFDIHHIAVSGDRAAAWVTLHGRSTGPFVVRDAPDGSITEVFPPTGRPF